MIVAGEVIGVAVGYAIRRSLDGFFWGGLFGVFFVALVLYDRRKRV